MGGHECLYFILPKLTRTVLQFHKQGGRKTDQKDNRFTPHSIVGIATRLWAGWFRVQIHAGARDFIFCTMSTLPLGPIKPSI
jgi:hypothetical protein